MDSRLDRREGRRGACLGLVLMASAILPTTARAQDVVARIPDDYYAPIVVKGEEKAALQPGRYVFHGLDAPAIQVLGRGELTIPAGVEVSIEGPSGDVLLVQGDNSTSHASSGPVVHVVGKQRDLSRASLQGRIVIRDGGRMEVEQITLDRLHYRAAATGGDTVLKDGASLVLRDAATESTGGTGDHDTVATGSSVLLERSEYRKGSIYLYDSELEGVESSIGVCLFSQGNSSIDLTSSKVDAFGPILGPGTWEFTQDGKVTPDGTSWHYGRKSFNVRPDGKSARDKEDPDVMSWVLVDTDLSAWSFDVTDSGANAGTTRLTLCGFRDLPAGLSILLRFQETGADGEVDLGRLPAGPIDSSDGPDPRFDALDALADRAGIDLRLRDCLVSGWNLYTEGHARVAAACERLKTPDEWVGVFYETEAMGESHMRLYGSDVYAGYLSAEESATLTVDTCTIKAGAYDIRCIGTSNQGPSLVFRSCTFEREGDERRRVVALDGGLVEFFDTKDRDAVWLVCGGGGEIRFDGEIDCDEHLQ